MENNHTLGQAFGLEKMKGHPKRSNRLNVEVIGITKEIIENELELTLAIEAYQEIQMENSLDAGDINRNTPHNVP